MNATGGTYPICCTFFSTVRPQPTISRTDARGPETTADRGSDATAQSSRRTQSARSALASRSSSTLRRMASKRALRG